LGILDQIQFGQQVANQGFARVPNGTGDFEIQNPTFGYNNDLANDVADFNADNWIIYPVPANDYLFVTADQPSTSMHCTVYDFAGRAIWSSTENGNFSIDVSAWSAGFYVLNNGISSKQFVITR
jgi:hypothetical protein